ncbi:hypothetical protein PENTCL1PPCAC_16819, partial [Pristionchus entomophagus]
LPILYHVCVISRLWLGEGRGETKGVEGRGGGRREGEESLGDLLGGSSLGRRQLHHRLSSDLSLDLVRLERRQRILAVLSHVSVHDDELVRLRLAFNARDDEVGGVADLDETVHDVHGVVRVVRRLDLQGEHSVGVVDDLVLGGAPGGGDGAGGRIDRELNTHRGGEKRRK